MLIREITIRNLLSFGPETKPFELRPLNVLIGPNGSGKSNFIDVIELLRSTTNDIWETFRRSGGTDAWRWKRGEDRGAQVTARILNLSAPGTISHSIAWLPKWDDHEAIDRELIMLDNDSPQKVLSEADQRHQESPFKATNGHSGPAKYNFRQSVLSQLRDPVNHPQLALLTGWYERIRIYRDWSFGRRSAIRAPEPAGGRRDLLREDLTNLASVLHELARRDHGKAPLLEALNELYPDIKDVDGRLIGDSFLEVCLNEDGVWISGARLSDGTLRYLCLLVILLDPTPPPLICIEEPELGLHPDVIVSLADLLKEASERTQLIVTTHSTTLIDCFTDSPEDVVVCQKDETGSTVMDRLDPERMKVWVKDYSLSDLWTSGQIGGNRW